MKRIAVSNANFYLEVGDTLGLDPVDQPSSMLLWGSLANVRYHLELLAAKSDLKDRHKHIVDEGLVKLSRIVSNPYEIKPATPGGRRDQGPFDCREENTEHGLISWGAAYVGNSVEWALKAASDQGYCERCLVASQVGKTLSVLISGARREGLNDAEIMTVISDLVLHGYDQADAGEPVPHNGSVRERLQ